MALLVVIFGTCLGSAVGGKLSRIVYNDRKANNSGCFYTNSMYMCVCVRVEELRGKKKKGQTGARAKLFTVPSAHARQA